MPQRSRAKCDGQLCRAQRTISGGAGGLPDMRSPVRTGREDTVSASHPAPASSAIESAICHAGTAEDGAERRNIIVVGAIGGKNERPVARPEPGCPTIEVIM